MATGSHIAAIGAEQGAGAGTPAPAPATRDDADRVAAPPGEDELVLDDGETPAMGRGIMDYLPACAGLAVAGWTGFYLWANAGLLPAASPAAWAWLISGWATPVMVIGLGWLIAMRTSRREAGRFGDAARALAAESARLETRLLTVNRELSLAREFIAAQSRDMDSLGRVAAERLSQHAERLATLVQGNAAQVEAIGTVSVSALANMEQLRGHLPVLASAAKDVTNNIGNAGRIAHAQLEDMIAGLNRLNEFGQACERQVGTVRARVEEALDILDARLAVLESASEHRLEALAEAARGHGDALAAQEEAALAGLRQRAAILSDEIAAARAALDAQEAESLTSLRARLTAMRDEAGLLGRSLRDGEGQALEKWRAAITRIEADMRAAIATLEDLDRAAMDKAQARLSALAGEATRLEQALGESAEHFDADFSRRQSAQMDALGALDARNAALLSSLAAIEGQIGAVGAAAQATGDAMSARLAQLAENLGDGRRQLAETDTAVASLTDASARLLELIRAGARLGEDDLPRAIGSGEDRLAALEAHATRLAESLDAAAAKGDQLGLRAHAVNDTLAATMDELTAMHEALAVRAGHHAEALAGLRHAVAGLDAESESLASKARTELAAAIALLEESARAALGSIQQQGAVVIGTMANTLGQDSAAAIERAMRLHTAEISGQLEQSAAHAAGVAREATIQLRNQLTKVDELVGALERRVAQARERAEEQVDSDFARRVALITESLNSNAIDIAKALAADIGDTAWAAYLRGDRGIFTRRAVKLLENGEAKAIAQLYEADSRFHDHVSHFIHDFEAMLRQLLSTRDGHALGVTLLSSDMGKLYVALAQAIERLRG